MKPGTIVLLVVLAAIGTVAGLFGWQNWPTQVDLVLSLGPIGAWHLGDPAALPLVLGITLLAGAVIGMIPFASKAGLMGRRARSLQRQVESMRDEIEFYKRSPPAQTQAAPRPVVPKPPVPVPLPVAAAPAAPASAPAPAPPRQAPAAADPPDVDDLGGVRRR